MVEETFQVAVSNPKSGFVLYVGKELEKTLNPLGRLAFYKETKTHFVFISDPTNGVKRHIYSEEDGNFRYSFRHVEELSANRPQHALIAVDAYIYRRKLYVSKPDPALLRPPANKNRAAKVIVEPEVIVSAEPEVHDTVTEVVSNPIPAVVPVTDELVMLTVAGKTIEFNVPTGELFSLSLEWVQRGYMKAVN